MRRLVIVIPVIVLLLALPFVVFLARAPVLVLTDASFDGIYGEKRSNSARSGLSLKFFRRVKAVRINENSDTGMQVFALEAASSRPYCVLIPYRYAEGGRRYAEQFPDIPVGVLGVPFLNSRGEEENVSPTGRIQFFRTDRERDFYLAGRCAALLADRGTVMVYHNRDTTAFRDAIKQGMDEGPEPLSRRDLQFMGPGAETSDFGGVSCVIFERADQTFFEKGPKIPIILFSWIDPDLTSRETRVIFDDSPWAQAVEAVKMTVQGSSGSLPSRLIIPVKKPSETGVPADPAADSAPDPALAENLKELTRFYRK
jgi:hypothetical protein